MLFVLIISSGICFGGCFMAAHDQTLPPPRFRTIWYLSSASYFILKVIILCHCLCNILMSVSCHGNYLICLGQIIPVQNQCRQLGEKCALGFQDSALQQYTCPYLVYLNPLKTPSKLKMKTEQFCLIYELNSWLQNWKCSTYPTPLPKKRTQSKKVLT